MTEDSRDDLAFVREMTEAGRSAPLLGGRFFVFYGLLLPIAYCVQWMVLDGRFGLPMVTIAVIWISFGIAIALGMPLMLRSLRRKPGRGAVGNRVEAVVWTTSGYAIFAAFLGSFFGTVVMDQPLIIWDFILAVAFGAYGIALYTTGALSEARWLKTFAVISLVAAGVVPVLAGRAELYLFAATAILVVSLIPGVRLMANEPKSLPAEEAA